MNRRLLGYEHPDVGRCLASLADLYIRTGRSKEAEVMAGEARHIFAATLSDDHWRTAWAGSIEGAALTDMSRFSQAEDRLLRSYGILKERAGVREIYVRNVLTNLVRLYDKWEKPDRAAIFESEVAMLNSPGS
jgi:hypothetical protein